MKKLFTKSVKEIGFKVFKNLLPLSLFLFLLPNMSFAQLYNGTVDVGIFEATAPNTIEIRIRPTEANSTLSTTGIVSVIPGVPSTEPLADVNGELFGFVLLVPFDLLYLEN